MMSVPWAQFARLISVPVCRCPVTLFVTRGNRNSPFLLIGCATRTSTYWWCFSPSMSLHKRPSKINPDEVDPSVYYYDEVYDEMKEDEQKQKNDQSSKSRQDKQPKYTQGLIESANLRKTEKELRRFKKYARDRDDARADIDDEDVYVTSSYKKKLSEIKKLEEEYRSKLEEEKDKAFNFSRKTDKREAESRNAACSSGKAGTSASARDKTTKREQDETLCEKETTDTRAPELKSNEKIEERRRPTTTRRERREYLEKVLAKRTIGEKYEEAVRRYIKRKSEARSEMCQSS